MADFFAEQADFFAEQYNSTTETDMGIATTEVPDITSALILQSDPADDRVYTLDTIRSYFTENTISIGIGGLVIAATFWVIAYLVEFFAPVQRRYQRSHDDNDMHMAEEMTFLEKAIESVSSWIGFGGDNEESATEEHNDNQTMPEKEM